VFIEVREQFSVEIFSIGRSIGALSNRGVYLRVYCVSQRIRNDHKHRAAFLIAHRIAALVLPVAASA